MSHFYDRSTLRTTIKCHQSSLWIKEKLLWFSTLPFFERWMSSIFIHYIQSSRELPFAEDVRNGANYSAFEGLNHTFHWLACFLLPWKPLLIGCPFQRRLAPPFAVAWCPTEHASDDRSYPKNEQLQFLENAPLFCIASVFCQLLTDWFWKVGVSVDLSWPPLFGGDKEAKPLFFLLSTTSRSGLWRPPRQRHDL